MERREMVVAVVAFLVVFASAWAIPASLAAPGHVSTHGEAKARTLQVAPGNSASFSWPIVAQVEEPDLVKIHAHIPMDYEPTLDASHGADIWIELAVNGESAYKFRFGGGGTDPIPVWFAQVPGRSDRVDWSALRQGTNHLTFYLNASFPDGPYTPRGGIEVSGGPPTLEIQHADSDGDGVADVNQPIPFLPTYLVAALLGLAAAGGGVVLSRRVRR